MLNNKARKHSQNKGRWPTGLGIIFKRRTWGGFRKEKKPPSSFFSFP